MNNTTNAKLTNDQIIELAMEAFPERIDVSVTEAPADLRKGDETGWLKVLHSNGAPQSGGNRNDRWPLPVQPVLTEAAWRPGAWTESREPHVCSSGWHVTARQGLHNWIKVSDYEQTIFIAELEGKVSGADRFAGEGKVAGERARLIEPVVKLDDHFTAHYVKAMKDAGVDLPQYARSVLDKYDVRHGIAAGESTVNGEPKITSAMDVSMVRIVLSERLANLADRGGLINAQGLMEFVELVEIAKSRDIVRLKQEVVDDIKTMVTYLFERLPVKPLMVAVNRYGQKVELPSKDAANKPAPSVSNDIAHTARVSGDVDYFLTTAHWSRTTQAGERSERATVFLQRCVRSIQRAIDEVRNHGPEYLNYYDQGGASAQTTQIMREMNGALVSMLRLRFEALEAMYYERRAEFVIEWAFRHHGRKITDSDTESNVRRRPYDERVKIQTYCQDLAGQELIQIGLDWRDAQIAKLREAKPVKIKAATGEEREMQANKRELAKLVAASEKKAREEYIVSARKTRLLLIGNAQQEITVLEERLAQARAKLKRAKQPVTAADATDANVTHFVNYGHAVRKLTK